MINLSISYNTSSIGIYNADIGKIEVSRRNG